MAAALPVFAGLSVAGSALGAVGQIQQGNAQRAIGEQNAQIAEANAHQADLATADQLTQLARSTSYNLGKQRAAFAGSGVKRTGTALDVLADTVNTSERDAYRISQQGALARQGYEFQAAQSRFAGRTQQLQSRIGAGSTLLTGFGNTALSYRFGQAQAEGGTNFWPFSFGS